MGCHSVQALWASTPPVHDVVAVVALQNPPSLWTGSSHGDIILWTFSSGPSGVKKKELWPLSMLCGHSAAIVDLEACNPGKFFECKDIQGAEENRFSNVYRAVVSACFEGWLCAWDSITGRCRRRRRLPPWVGSPSLIMSLPSAQRYICVACNGETVGLPQSFSRNDGNSKIRNPEDCEKVVACQRVGIIDNGVRGAVVVVDSLTLDILHVVHNGFLGMGPMKSMLILPDSKSSHKVIVSDLCGRIQFWAIDHGKLGKGESVVEKSEQEKKMSPTNAYLLDFEDAQTVSFSPDGRFILLVSASHWSIALVEDETIVPKVVCMKNTHLNTSDSCFLTGGFFLINEQINGCTNMLMKLCGKNMFVVWNIDGAAVLYSLCKLGGTLHTEVVCQIPASISNCGGECNIKFSQFLEFLVCVVSQRASSEIGSAPEMWIRLWCIPAQPPCKFESSLPSITVNSSNIEDEIMVLKSHISDGNKDTTFDCGQVRLSDHWLRFPFANLTNDVSNLDKEMAGLRVGTNSDCDSKMTKRGSFGPSLLVTENRSHVSGNCKNVSTGNWVTASILLSGNYLIPSTIVFGYNSGEIRLLVLQAIEPTFIFHESTSVDNMTERQAMQCLIKHTAPILCLAEHNMLPEMHEPMLGKSKGQVLISGGMDCLVCIWDLKRGGELLAVLHHHVASVCHIVLPPLEIDLPWSNCFISSGEDGCVALISLETLRVERMFPGHPIRPRMITWDGVRGYIACLCSCFPGRVVESDVLYIWDLKSGALERDPRGAGAHSMFNYFLKRTQGRSMDDDLVSGRATSLASLLNGDEDSVDGSNSLQRGCSSASSGYAFSRDVAKADAESTSNKVIGGLEKLSSKLSQAFNQGSKPAVLNSREPLFGAGTPKFSNFNLGTLQRNLFHKKQPIKGVCPLPGLAVFQIDLFALMTPHLGRLGKVDKKNQQHKETSLWPGQRNDTNASGSDNVTYHEDIKDDMKDGIEEPQGEVLVSDSDEAQLTAWLDTYEACLLRMSLSFLHLWGADLELDRLLEKKLQIFQSSQLGIAVGLPGDRGAMTLMLPGWHPSIELWKISPEFCALRSLTIVAVAQRMITSSRPTSNASSALAAFYTRGLAEKFPDVSAPSLELYACFWQDPSEHVRMAARSLFHCAASRAIPSFLCPEAYLAYTTLQTGNSNQKTPLSHDEILENRSLQEARRVSDPSPKSEEICEWLESFEGQDWTAIVGGTNQDARAVRIIVGAALAVWYPHLVTPVLAVSVVPYLVNLVKSVIDRHSATAAEILADGMDAIWQHLISSEIPDLISDIFLLIECLSGGASANSKVHHNPATAMTIRETLTGSLLPSLAMIDVPSFLKIVQKQLSAATSNSQMHLVSLMVIIRIVRGAPRAVVPYLSQVTSAILQTMKTGKHCFQSAMAAVREMVRVFPMVALHQGSGKLAVGDAIGDVHTLTIQIYDLNSVTKIKVLDASGPPGHPALVARDGLQAAVGISALSFSQDGEGLVAFSLQGLMIRWWSLGGGWWEKLSRSNVLVQCTKLVLVPPWAGFSPKSSRSSIMATISNPDIRDRTEEHHKGLLSDDTTGKVNCHNVDLSYRMEWRGVRSVLLLYHGQEVGIFQL